MLLSYVLRLVPEALAAGRFAGTVQIVDTGRTVAFSSVDELLVVLMPRPRDGGDAPGASRTLDLDARRATHAATTPENG